MKQKVRSNKVLGVVESDADVLEGAVLEMKQRKSILENEIFRDEGTYLSVAQSKLEKKLKSGVQESLANQYQRTIDGAKIKQEQKKEQLNSKIEKLNSDKLNFRNTIQAKIDNLEAQLRENIDKLEAQVRANDSQIDNKITSLERDIESNDNSIQRTIDYHQPLLDKCYEETPVVVVYPPSHHKKKEELRLLISQIESTHNSILAIKAREYDDSKNMRQQSNQEEMIRKLREQSAREDAEALRLAREEQEEEERLAAIQRKRIYNEEKEQRRLRYLEREQEFKESSTKYDDLPEVEETPESEDSEDEREQERWLKEQDMIRAAKGLPPLPRYK